MRSPVRQFADELFENPAAMFVIFKLIEAGAGRRKKDNVARARSMRSDFDRALQRSGAFHGNTIRNLAFDFLRCSSYEQSKNCLFAQE